MDAFVVDADLQAVAFRSTGGLFAPAPTPLREVVEPGMVAAGVQNFASLGFTVEPALVEALLSSSKEDFIAWHKDVTAVLAGAVGFAAGRTAPFYPNFPRQVAEASEAELFFNALMHYFGRAVGVRVMPDYEVEPRNLAWRFPELKTLRFAGVAGDSDALSKIVSSLLGSVLSWGETERADFSTVLSVSPSVTAEVLSDGSLLSNKENLASAWVLAFKGGEALQPVRSVLEAGGFFKGATDVLRAAAALHSLDNASLSPVTVVNGEELQRVKFTSLPGSVRRFFLSVIESDEGRLNAFAKRAGLWKAFGNVVHPGDYKGRFPKSWEAFVALRNGRLAGEFSETEKAVAVGDIRAAIASLEGRPGVLVRRLDEFARLADDNEFQALVEAVASVGKGVSSNVLWQAISHFERRGTTSVRAVFPKGNVSRAVFVPALAGLSSERVGILAATLRNAVTDSYSARTKTEGFWWIDPVLSSVKIPNAIRNASDALTPVGRGTRMQLPEFADGVKPARVRLFTHWKDMDDYSTVDIDLSAALYDEDFASMGSVWYGNLRGAGQAIVHSGDIVSAPNGAVEFIDVDIEALKVAMPKVRYVGVTVNSYSGQILSSIPECFAGVSVVDDPQAGEVYDARSVVHKFQIASPARNTVPLMFDVVTGEVIWVDSQVAQASTFGSNIVQTGASTGELLRAVLEKPAATVGDVLTTNIIARGGVVVGDPEKADHKVTFNQDGLSIPMRDVLSEWL